MLRSLGFILTVRNQSDCTNIKVKYFFKYIKPNITFYLLLCNIIIIYNIIDRQTCHRCLTEIERSRNTKKMTILNKEKVELKS